ncbi:MAG: MFS transporter [Coxiellaceae bacterium]|nr:MFS transporter [Coxiellaceae bacterium]
MNSSTAIKYPLLFMLCITTSAFMGGVDLMIMSVAIDPMRHFFNVNVNTAQWLMSAYAIGCAACYIGIGRISDHFGKRNTLNFGIILFGLSSLGVALSTDIYLAIAFRFLQGVGMAALVNSSTALVMEYYSVEQRPKKIAFLITGAGFGFSLGPVIGGILLHYFSWSALFYINIPFSIAALTISLACVPTTGNRYQESVNYINLLLLTLSITFLSIFASQAQHWGWSSGYTWASIVIAIIVLGIYIALERLAKTPLIDPEIFNLKNVISGCACGFLLYVPLIGWLLVFGLYFQSAYGLSRLQTGFAFLPYAAGFIVMPMITAKLMKFLSHKTVIVIGFFIAAISLPVMNIINPQLAYWYLVAPFFFFSAGCNMVNTSTLPVALQFVPHERHGVASGIAMMTRWLGGALGTAAISSIFAVGQATSDTHAVHLSLWVLTGVTAFATVYSWLAVKHTH